MDEIVKMQAEIMKTFAHPVRMKIIKAICKSEKSAAEILKITKLSKANLSQHMRQIINSGLVFYRKEGVQIFYRLANRKISKACELMQEIAMENLKYKAKVLQKIKTA